MAEAEKEPKLVGRQAIITFSEGVAGVLGEPGAMMNDAGLNKPLLRQLSRAIEDIAGSSDFRFGRGQPELTAATVRAEISKLPAGDDRDAIEARVMAFFRKRAEAKTSDIAGRDRRGFPDF